MNRVQLFYKDISEITGGRGFSVARLTDIAEQRAICVICDKAISDQMAIRYKRIPGREQMLPEVLLQMLADSGLDKMELTIYDIFDGQYRVTLLNKRSYSLKAIRMSDALLLHYIAHVPIFIEEDLMTRQSTPYSADTLSMSIPINTLGIDHLNRELERAIAEENYRLASHLHDEIKRRTGK